MQPQEEYIWERLLIQYPYKNTDVTYENHLLVPSTDTKRKEQPPQ